MKHLCDGVVATVKYGIREAERRLERDCHHGIIFVAVSGIK